MTRKTRHAWLFIFIAVSAHAERLPDQFVYLSDIEPSIQQDIRYAGNNNFIGHTINGYEANECIVTKPTAIALKAIQHELKQSSLGLSVYDCYRPQIAVDEFIAWSKQPNEQSMKHAFYPQVDKRDFFTLGYVAEKSGHSRGSTVDLTIIRLSDPDNSIDMGTGFDYMDPRSHTDNNDISRTAKANRQRLTALMQQHGFTPYPNEWWHFTLNNEPYPTTYFNFKIQMLC